MPTMPVAENRSQVGVSKAMPNVPVVRKVCWASLRSPQPTRENAGRFFEEAPSSQLTWPHEPPGLFARRDDLTQIIRRALDTHQMRILQAIVVIQRNGLVPTLILQQQLNR
jgi:hypothetical protein